MNYHRAKEIFTEAVKLAPEDRGAYLDEHCGDDADLRAKVDSLLLNHSSTVKDQSPQRIAGEYQRGDIVGPFTIRDRLGSGGMGAVYLAEQTSPVRRQVALKVIKPGFDTRNTLARFHAEQQALAMMDHPCIAKVLEAGATDTGRPWFAMEYIKGQDLNTYCDQNKLDTTQRLELFMKVCDAIQHAHQKGIMHRDLKPGNVLVARDEHDQPQPKVIDFGIAKAVSNTLTDMTLHTTIGQLVGTLSYMSPEQVSGSADIDTRTDVYSLGVILYELLSGQVPFSGETTSESGQEAMKKSIREVDPPKPSMQLSSVDNDEATAIAQARRTDTTSLQNTLRRELEWIPLKALRKDRRERYATPEALAADVQRYLDGEALEAGPITKGYRLRKFVKRNKVPVFTAASFVLVLIAATAVSLILFRHAQQQSSQATAATQFLGKMFVSVTPKEAGSLDSELVLLILDRAVDSIDSTFREHPEIAADLYFVMSTNYNTFSIHDKALDLAQKSLSIRTDKLQQSKAQLYQVNWRIGSSILFTTGFYGSSEEYAAAIPFLRDACDGCIEAKGLDHRTSQHLIDTIATVYRWMKDYSSLVQFLTFIVDLHRTTFGNDHSLTADWIYRLGKALESQSKYEEAMPFIVESLETRRRILGDEHPDTLYSITAMGKLLFKQDNHDEAMPYIEEALTHYLEELETRRRVLGDEHPLTLHSINTLAELHEAWHEAEPEAGHDVEAAEYRQMLEEIQGANSNATAEPAAP